MRINPVEPIIREGGVAIGTMMMEFATTGIGRIAAEAQPARKDATLRAQNEQTKGRRDGEIVVFWVVRPSECSECGRSRTRNM